MRNPAALVEDAAAEECLGRFRRDCAAQPPRTASNAETLPKKVGDDSKQQTHLLVLSLMIKFLLTTRALELNRGEKFWIGGVEVD